jgi:hypothetical protein
VGIAVLPVVRIVTALHAPIVLTLCWIVVPVMYTIVSYVVRVTSITNVTTNEMRRMTSMAT